MKKILVLLVIFVLVFASTNSYAGNPLKKLGRGAANIITSPIEIPYRIGEVNKEDGPAAAFSWGALNGIWRTGLRALCGVYEVVTFLVPLPEHYDPIIDDPEFFLNEGVF